MSTGRSASTVRHSYAAPASASPVSALGAAQRSQDMLLLLGRILIGGIFAVSGYGKLIGLSAFAARLEKNGVPFASVMSVVGASVEFFAGLAVVLGIAVRSAAILMIAFVIVATLISHRFWEFHDAVRQMQQTQFSKNMAILGGFVLLSVVGGGHLAVERLWRRH